MNYGIIKRTLGFLLIFEAIFFAVPAIVAIVCQEREIFDFLLAMLVSVAVGGILLIGKPKRNTLYAKEGIVIVAASWLLMSLIGALPFVFSGAIPSYIDALFETASGFTTTGATILSGEQIEALPQSLLMWRSFTHWLGGMGVLVFIMAFLPLCAGGNNINILRAESPGPSVGKLVPKMRSTAGILYLIYTGLTVLEFIFLVFGEMTVLEALNTAFATAGTGGFGVRADSLGGYSSYTQIVVTVFMVLFSINFTSYFFILRGKFKDAFNTEVCVFLGIVATAIALISLNLCLTESAAYDYTTGEAVKHSAFSVAAVISTTGFTTVDFNLWPTFSKTILVLLMFVGACAGSTGGGMKVSRMLILFKGATHEMKRMLHPKQIKKITLDKRIVDHEVVRGVNSYLIAFFGVYILSMLLVGLEGYDIVTTFTSVAATINNIGPGLNLVGPSGNFAFFNDFSKIVFIFDMLAGRLEIFPMLLLFAPSTWRK